MKRILFACFLLTATCAPTLYVQQAIAHPVTTPVTQADFNTKINLMDSYIGAGNMTAAQATWEEVHTMMLNVLHTTKESISGAATPAAKDAFMAVLNNQTNVYYQVWALKPDLATNRTAIHTKLVDFKATIY